MDDVSTKTIDLFNRITGWVFGELYSHHPMPENFSIEHMPDELRTALSAPDLEAQGEELLYNTLTWLKQNGFIEVKDNDLDLNGAVAVRLTLQGFQALSAIPSSLQPSETVGSKLAEFSKSSGKTAWSAVIATLVGTALGAAGKAITK